MESQSESNKKLGILASYWALGSLGLGYLTYQTILTHFS